MNKQAKYTGEERRRYLRLEPEEPIQVSFAVIDADRVPRRDAGEPAAPQSVSGGGMFLEIPRVTPDVLEALLRGEKKIVLRIQLPPGSPHVIEAIARVIWVEGDKDKHPQGYGVGVSFEQIAEADRDRIIDYIVQKSR